MRIRCSLLVALLAGACATAPKPVSLAALEPHRDNAAEEAGTWREVDGAYCNVIPGNATRQDIFDARNGIGVSTGLFPGFAAEDLFIEADVSFEGAAAPGLVFHAQASDEGVLESMYVVALYGAGVNLWRRSGNEWRLLHRHNISIPPRQWHTLRVVVRGDKMAVYVDGQALLEAQDPRPLPAGRAGIRGMQGVCRFSNVRVRSLD